jgi:hypothetical protein
MAKEDLMALSSPEAEDELAGMEEKAMEVAGEMDAEYDEDMESVAPEGSYDSRSLNALIDSINKILPLFDPSLPPIPPVEGDVKGKLPTEIVKAVSMITAAASDAMLPDLVPALDVLVDSRALQMAAGKIILLSKNRDFQMFLKSAPKMGESEGTEVEVKVETPAPAEGDMDNLMMSRMS